MTNKNLLQLKCNIRGVIRKFAENSRHFYTVLINRAGINTAAYMKLIGYNMLDFSRLRALRLSSRQRYIAQTGQV